MTKNYRHLFALAAVVWMLAVAAVSCGNSGGGNGPSGTADGTIATVADAGHFREILRAGGNRLLVFEFYADWCAPCKRLAPILDKLAREYAERTSFYKIDVDKNRELAEAVGMQGIPLVLFIRNGERVHSLMGLHPKSAYVRVIEQYADAAAPERKAADTPDGEIIEGVRVIRRSTSEALNTLYVYRGETVRMVIEDVRFPYAISIPDYGIATEAVAGRDLEVVFKADEVGVFPIFCNGDCPTGDGTQYGQIVVMPFTGSDSARFAELGAEQAKSLIAQKDPLILDVRTPAEYYSGHIVGAKLIPVQQLEARLNEIREYRDRDIFLYCRSGNRSTVAAQILMRDGFKKLHNLRYGIRDWQQKGYEVVK